MPSAIVGFLRLIVVSGSLPFVESCFAEEGSQLRSQPASRLVEVGLDRSLRDFEQHGDFPDHTPLHAQEHTVAHPRRQPLDGLAQSLDLLAAKKVRDGDGPWIDQFLWTPIFVADIDLH